MRRSRRHHSSLWLHGAALALYALAACTVGAGKGASDNATDAGANPDAGVPASSDGSTDDASSLEAGEAGDGPNTNIAGEIDAAYQPAVRYDFESGVEGWMRNAYDNSRNWGIVSVVQVLDPAQSGAAGDDAGADATLGGASLAARYADGGTNHVLQIAYDSALKPDGNVESYLEVVNPDFAPKTLGTLRGLTLSLDVYADHVANLDSTLQVLVQDKSYDNCFFAFFNLIGVPDRTWVTVATSDVGVCPQNGTVGMPQQLSFRFEPLTGAGNIYIDNITW